MKLVGADEMHFPCEDRLVSSICQIMRKRRNKTVVGVAVVVATGCRGIKAGHKAGSGWYTDWAGRVSVGEICRRLHQLRKIFRARAAPTTSF